MYICWVIPNIGQILSPLDEMLRSGLLSSLTGRPPPSNLKCALFILPALLGGVRIRIPSKTADGELLSSLLVTFSLKDHILNPDRCGYDIIAEQLQNKGSISRLNMERNAREADDLQSQMSDSLQREVDLAKRKGAYIWLAVLSLTDHDFVLHKSAFHDALALQDGWTLTKLPSKYDCGNGFTVELVLSMKFVTLPPINLQKYAMMSAFSLIYRQ